MEEISDDFSSVCWSDRDSHLVSTITLMARVVYESFGQFFSERKQENFLLS